MSPRLTATLLAATAAVGLTTTSAVAKEDGDRAKPAEYVLQGDRVFPEGIATLGERRFFVGSTTDGTIFRGDTRRARTTILSPGGTDGRTTAVGMKADRRGNLIVAGGATGKVFVLDAETGATRKVLDTAPGGAPTFLNDVALGKGGVAYVTDSQRPVLHRVTLPEDGEPTIEPFLDLTGTPLQYQPGFNLNGIAAAKGGKVLVVVQSNTGRLFRIDTATKAVSAIDTGGAALTNGDGLVLRGRTLRVVRNMQELIVPVKLSEDLTRGRVGTGVTSPALKYPTTAAFSGGRLLVVNAQFDKRQGTPELPFSVVALRAGKGR